jgi:hypothetical protein
MCLGNKSRLQGETILPGSFLPAAVLWVCLLIPGCALFGQRGGADAGTASSDVPVGPALNICRDQAREALMSHCGRCHQKSRSEKPRALNIYDLEEDEWYGRLKKKHIEGIKRRLGGSKAATKSEKESVFSCMDFLRSR